MFDTLLYTKRLEASGLSREMAEAQVNVILEMIVDGVTTKPDLVLLKSEFKEEILILRQDIGILKPDVATLKSDVAELKSDVAVLKSDVAVLKSDVAVLKSDVAVLKSDVTELKVDFSLLKQNLVTMEHRLTLRLGGMMVGGFTLMLTFMGLFLR